MNNWSEQLDKLTKQFETNFNGLSTEQLNWKPSQQGWSIAQNIHHLIMVNESYYPAFKSLHEGTFKKPFIAKAGFMVSFFGKTILKAVNPDRKKKMKTFAIWTPAASKIDGDIISRFEQHQIEMKRQIETFEKLIREGAVISSPANKNIVYKLATAFDILVAHEERHLNQAKEVLELLGKSAGS